MIKILHKFTNEHLYSLKRSSLRDGRDIVTQSCESLDLSYGVVAQIIFETELDESNWTDSVVSNVDFHTSFFWDSNFSNASFKNVLWHNASLKNSDFSNAELIKVRFLGADLENCDFSGCLLDEVAFGKNNLGGYSSIKGTDLSNTDLSSCDFQNVYYNDATKFPASFKVDEHLGLQKF